MTQQTTNAMMLSTSTTSDVSPDAMYSQPELIDTIVYPDFIELVYKRQYMVTIGHRMPNPDIYSEVYSRRDGSMYTKKGTYIPAQPESYEF
jgi:hypothetical protein